MAREENCETRNIEDKPVVIDELKPTERLGVISLVAGAGLNVSKWSVSRKGPVRVPETNPAYCYEWAFREPGKVVLNIWYRDIRNSNGQRWMDLNLRELSKQWSGVVLGRAKRMEAALECAYKERLKVRLIIGDGVQGSDSGYEMKARMTHRLLDPNSWSVEQFDQATGNYRLVRQANIRFADQFSSPESLPPRQRDVSGQVWDRNPRVREAVLLRANGVCELCDQPGFRTLNGGIYLETHHVIALSEGGVDDERNVVAICPNDHRRAHHSEDRESLCSRLLEFLRGKYAEGSSQEPIVA